MWGRKNSYACVILVFWHCTNKRTSRRVKSSKNDQFLNFLTMEKEGEV